MFLDIKLGLLWAILIAIIFDRTLTPLWFLSGVLFALLPDTDFWIEYAMRGTVGGKTMGAHRSLLHNPLPYIPITLFVGTFFGPAWMTLFAFGVFGHFAHDFSGMGLGIQAFWPLSERWYKLFSSKDGEIHYDMNHLYCSWSQTEIKALVSKRGNDNWIHEELRYMKEHRIDIFMKLCVVILGIMVLIAVLPL